MVRPGSIRCHGASFVEFVGSLVQITKCQASGHYDSRMRPATVVQITAILCYFVPTISSRSQRVRRKADPLTTTRYFRSHSFVSR
jgi:hypothetical protein